MTVLPAPARRPRRRRHLSLVPPPTEAPATADHCSATRVEAPCDYRLRLVEYSDGLTVRRFECDACGGVSYR